MGAVSFSIDVELVRRLREALPLEVFVETGTFEGESTQRALPFFQEIHSVELSREYYEKACVRFEGVSAVTLHHGRSDRVLEALRPLLEGRAVLYWLDAHWCVAESTAGETSQCPLLGELSAIGQLHEQSIVLIDDARLFLCPPPAPHESDQWPGLNEILPCLQALSAAHELAVVNDVILYYPQAIRETVRAYAIDKGVDWAGVLYTLRQHEALVSAQQGEIDRLSKLLAQR